MANTTITPIGNTLALSIQGLTLPAIGALALGGVSVTLAVGITPAVGSVGITGVIPPLASGRVTPLPGSTTLAGQGPLLDIKVAGGAPAAITLGGIAPVMSPGVAPTMVTGTSQLNGAAPGLALGIVTPLAGGVTLVGSASTVVIPNTTVAPLAGALALVGRLSVPGGAVSPPIGTIVLSSAVVRLDFKIAFAPVTTPPIIFGGDPSINDLGITPQPGLLLVTTIGIRAPVISPSAAVLSLTGVVPVAASSSRSFIPASVALSLAGVPANMVLTVPAAPAANLVMGGLNPSLVITNIIAPLAGAVTFDSTAPSSVITRLITPQGTVITILEFSPLLGIRLNIPAGVLGESGAAPVISIGTLLNVNTGVIGLVGTQPVLTPGVSITTAASSLVLGGVAPVVLPATVIPGANLSLGAAAPGLALTLTPPVTTLVFSGATPTINGNAILVALPGVVGLTGQMPVQGRFGLPGAGNTALSGFGVSLNFGIGTSTGGFTLTGVASTVAQDGLPLSQTGSALLAGAAPALSFGHRLPTGAIQFSSALPLVNSLTTLTPIVGTITFGSSGSVLAQVGVIIPASGAVALVSNAQVLIRSGFAAPGTATLIFTETLPRVFETTTGLFTPDTADMSLVGQPAVNSLYEPDLYHVVTLNGPSTYVVVLLG